MIALRLRAAVWFTTGIVVALIASLVVMTTWRADAAPGDKDSTFVPMTSCRLIDTRPPPHRVGPFSTWGPAATQTVQATGTNGNCTIPADAVGLSMNVTALNATVESFLTFWPSGALPLAANLNPFPGQPPIPNAVTVSLSPTGAFNLYNNLGSVDIVIDVGGYYTKQSLQDMQARLAELEKGTRAVTASGGIASMSSMTFVDVPGAAASATTSTNGRLLITFSSEVSCEDSGTTPFTAWCIIDVLVDGKLASPGTVIYDSGRGVAAGSSLWTSRSHQFITGPLAAGPHTVQVRYRVGEALVIFRLDQWVLSVLPLRP